MNKIIVIIATKNRVNLLKKAMDSVLIQIKQPHEVIVVSDSNKENKEKEKQECNESKFTFLENKFTSNYAGNLNTAISYIIQKYLIESNNLFNNLFIAFLDDDDYWDESYLYQCYQETQDDIDFVVAGLLFNQGEGFVPLSIPSTLCIEQFLTGNPHIQGSNTFIRLTTLLKAGCFDENMSSTTDRDLFTRIMMLNPRYKIIHKHLVYIQAENTRNRLTNSKAMKKESLIKFYSKYYGLMTQELENQFFERAKKFAEINKKEIIDYLSFSMHDTTDSIPIQKNNTILENRIVFSFVSMDEKYANRLIDEILKQEFKNKKIILLINSKINFFEAHKKLTESGIEYFLITLDDVKQDIINSKFNSYITLEILEKGYIDKISIARDILHSYTKKETIDSDIIFILDDDMQFFQNVFKNGEIEREKLDLNFIINRYKNNYDVVVGAYSQDAPLPSLSTLRTSLLDYTYHYKLNKKEYFDKKVYFKPDYYYDLAENQQYLETPVQLVEEHSLEEVFSGKAISRILFTDKITEHEAYSRGGNTLIFNRKVLDIPNISLQIGKDMARRGDYFWVQQVKELGFNIIASTYSTYHNRQIHYFNYENEIDKYLKDLIGSSFTKAHTQIKTKSKQEFYQLFSYFYLNRLNKMVINYFRVIGLLEILKEDYFYKNFNYINVLDLIRKAKKNLNSSLISASYEHCMQIKNNHKKRIKEEQYKLMVESMFHTKVTKLLGFGEEGMVFTDEQWVYKIFYSHLNLSFDIQSKFFSNCEYLFDINLKQQDGISVIYYPFMKDYETYKGGYTLQLVNLLLFLKSKGLVLTNIKKENFIIANDCLKFIDYGKNIENFSIEKYHKSIERAYQMLKYDFLSSLEFKQLIHLSYQNKENDFNFGIENFKRLFNSQNKEQNHDVIILNLIRKFSPASMLDYGAGKCKIANHLSDELSVSVFDINQLQLLERARSNIEIIDNIDALNKKFDLISCNLVLCCTNNEQNNEILNNINRLLTEKGKLILSICNPFFDNIHKTETKRYGYNENYSSCCIYNKETKFINRKEYHRPFSYYKRLLHKLGFKILSIQEDKGVNIESLNEISEHLIIVCEKTPKILLEDCTLLIKTNPMEYNLIDMNIHHIVNQLEKYCFFQEIIVVVDEDNENRLRSYSDENRNQLLLKLNQLLDIGYIDKIIQVNSVDKHDIYRKYFNKIVNHSYASNGQQLYSSLYGLEQVKTKYVFQTDSDILYFNQSQDGLVTAFDFFKEVNALTLSLSICHPTKKKYTYGHRVEVRSCFINLHLLQEKLPLYNEVKDGMFISSWHRALDKHLLEHESIRLYDNELFFIHPENTLKTSNFISLVTSQVEEGNIDFLLQQNNVNVQGNWSNWVKEVKSNMVLFIRGRNTLPEKLKRLFNSLKNQKHQNFFIIYIDDNSYNLSVEYVDTIFKYDIYFKNKIFYILNKYRVGGLGNFEIAYRYIIKNMQSIIVNIDNDDCLMRDDALLLIQEKFDSGADVTVGNCFRTDKPLNTYRVESFEKVWERNGDNIWLHPKCFRRYLCNYIQDNIKQNDNTYFSSSCDYAIMLPIIENSHYPMFIEEKIYYFDISQDNMLKKGEYLFSQESKLMLLEKSKQRNAKKIIAVIGDSYIDKDSEHYKIAYLLGKQLIDNGYRIQTGGLGGVMEAVMEGAKQSHFYQKGDTIAILPSKNESEVNDYADVVVPTGLDILRNGKVIQASAVIVLGGGSGTLSEIAMAWQLFKLIIAFENIDGWGKQLSHQKLDKRIRYKHIQNDCIYGVTSVEEVIVILKNFINQYNRQHHGIKFHKSRGKK